MIKIIKEETHGTGGGCEVTFMTVEGLGDTKTVGFTEDCFAGYNCKADDILFDGTQELWDADSDEKLVFTIGEENAAVILQRYTLGGGK